MPIRPPYIFLTRPFRNYHSNSDRVAMVLSNSDRVAMVLSNPDRVAMIVSEGPCKKNVWRPNWHLLSHYVLSAVLCCVGHLDDEHVAADGADTRQEGMYELAGAPSRTVLVVLETWRPGRRDSATATVSYYLLTSRSIRSCSSRYPYNLYPSSSSVLCCGMCAAQALLGTNPMTVAAPGENGQSFVLDMATSAVALGKVRSPCPALPCALDQRASDRAHTRIGGRPCANSDWFRFDSIESSPFDPLSYRAFARSAHSQSNLQYCSVQV